MAEYQRYPMVMYHPHEQAAILCDEYAGTAGTRPPIGYQAPIGRARQFPPVTVMNADQEEYHLSRGYEPGASTKAAYEKAQAAAALPPGFQDQEYPKMVDGQIVHDPHRPPPVDNQYPKYVDAPDGTQVIAKNAAEEVEILGRGSTKNEPIKRGDEAERRENLQKRREELAAQLAALDGELAAEAGEPVMKPRRVKPAKTQRSAPPNFTRRWELIRKAQALGIPADKTWKLPALEQALEEEKHEKQTEAA